MKKILIVLTTIGAMGVVGVQSSAGQVEDVVDVVGIADMAINKLDAPDPATRGSELTYTLNVTNRGPSDATGVVVQDRLAASLDFVSATASSGDCQRAARLVTCELDRLEGGLLAPGERARVLIVVRPTVTGGVVNRASVAADQIDPNSANDDDREFTQVVAPCGGEDVTIAGTGGDDRIVGTAGNDVIAGLGGADRIDGRGGNDVICGGRGRDVIRGGAGNDALFGQRGPDKLFGNAGNDLLNGGPGRDTCRGGPGNNRLVSCER